MKIEFRMVKKEAIKDQVKSVTIDLPSRKEFDKKLRELREENYVLEYQVPK